MTALADLIRFAVSNGFWTFVGVAVLMGIVTDGARCAALTLLSTLKR